MRSRGTLAILASTMMFSTWLVGGAAPASAAGPCGSGYNLVGSYPIPASGAKTGTINVYYNSGSGKNCAIAKGTGSNYGKKNYKVVGISVSGAGRWTGYDSGLFSYYAGPVYVSARNKCIDVLGGVGSPQRVVRKVHCG
ncbi:hypothetical protein ACFQX6_47540 [Streptosporangium lutulentum]